jgi:hypothetical protein
MAREDHDKVFSTLSDAQASCDRLNQDPPEHGYSPWYVGGKPGEGRWVVVRARGVIART